MAYTYGTTNPMHYTPQVLLNASLETGLPMMFPEWNGQNAIENGNPKCCRFGNDVNQIFRDFLNTNADRIVIDLVFEPTAITKGSYKDTSTSASAREGSRQWDLGVDTYIAGWGRDLGAVKQP